MDGVVSCCEDPVSSAVIWAREGEALGSVLGRLSVWIVLGPVLGRLSVGIVLGDGWSFASRVDTDAVVVASAGVR